MLYLSKTLDLDYPTYNRKHDIHGTVIYPATMIAPMQNYLMQEIINECKIESILDPFHGSGTTLYEAISINNNLTLYGIDINPLANLITTVKLNGVSQNIDSNIEFLYNVLTSDIPINYSRYFKNITKWFRVDIIESLTFIYDSISKVENDKDRLFFLVLLY